ncbi:hypothetical protein RSAG8_06159, partial [Rhizoctonia solani AG-8 WAC10335]
MSLDFAMDSAAYLRFIVMPKSSKPKPATQPKPSKPVLSSTAKAAQRERVTEYKNAKASTIASSVKGKGVRYYDDDDGNGNGGDDDNGNVNDSEDGEDDEEGEGGSDGKKMEDGEECVPEHHLYKSTCGNFIFIPDEKGDYTKYPMLTRPEGKIKNLPQLMDMDGPENKELFQGIRSCIRRIALHVARNIPNCTYPMLSDEQKGSIMLQARKQYPILGRYRQGWATKELTIRSLTNGRDHKARIQKAGGQAAWCTSLKEKREVCTTYLMSRTTTMRITKATSV